MTEVLYVQKCIAGDVRCSASVRCGACGLMAEIDGNEAPSDVRNAFLNTSGQWQIVLLKPGDRRLDVVRLVAEVRGYSIKEALQLMKDESESLAQGTRVEMVCTKERFESVGASVRVERVPPG